MSLYHLVPVISQVGGTKMQREEARRRKEDVQTETEERGFMQFSVLYLVV